MACQVLSRKYSRVGEGYSEKLGHYGCAYCLRTIKCASTVSDIFCRMHGTDMDGREKQGEVHIRLRYEKSRSVICSSVPRR